jgi:hypothetical protein
MVNDGTLDALLTLTLKDCDRSSKFEVLPQFTVGDLSSSPSDKNICSRFGANQNR